MSHGDDGDDGTQTATGTPFRVRLPRFVLDEEIGLGDAIKRATAYFGVRPCGGCERRAAAINRHVVLSPRRSR